ncbi:hypothetical protein FNH05_22015 [Amycolatopsis rhizosphaerae]|uniref:Uncharacterized protein n=1 Tax=Amycolatopsis rhizosphaerae TaxID=2053003 RepID=A0A558C568_9PSEU|nr:hypothetical protein [Amycolatopsis rhizosphaerae]TVT43939.1 hypothetical protein FNH05_22015 [Amycolatopsis rhizosphaerae]
MAESLESLRWLDSAAQREHLLADTGRDANWWLGLIQQATLRATDPEATEEARRSWTVLAVTLLDTALESGGLADREVVTRKAKLSLALARHGRPEEFSAALRPGLVARECLALAEMTPDEAAATPWRPRAEDVEVMRRLRKVRNVVAPAVELAAYIEDESTKREVDAWRAVLPKLP